MKRKFSLQVSGLGASYDSRVILAELDFALPAQGVTALLGPVAAGKSTLIRTLAGLNANNPRFRSWGQVDYAGKQVQSSPPDAAIEANLPRLVQQSPKLMMATAQDALLELVRPTQQRTSRQWRDWVVEQLQVCGFPDLALVLDVPTVQLTPVQQRVITILRQAWSQPALLMLDEPTAKLKGYEAYLLLDLIKQVAQHSAVLLVTQQQEHAQMVAQNMLLLAGGRIQEAGPMADFLHTPASAAGQQFARTGDCAVPMPGTPVHELADDVLPPPPLPAAALRAIAEFQSLDASGRLQKDERTTAVNSARKAIDAAVIQVAPPLKQTAPLAQQQAANTPVTGAHRSPAKPAVSMEILPLQADVAAIAATHGPKGFNWLVAGRLAGTPSPGVEQSMDEDLKALKRCGVTMLISLTNKDLPQDAVARHGLKNFHLPVYDSEPPTVAQVQMLLARMAAAMRSGEVLAVHCICGLGCTGTVLAAWLMRCGLSAQEALLQLQQIDALYAHSQMEQTLLHKYERALGV